MDVVDLARRQHQGAEAAGAIGERVDFGRGAAARAADGLVLLPPFAPAAERWARTAVLSTMAKSGGSSQATSAASSPCQMPFSLQRSKRLNSVVHCASLNQNCLAMIHPQTTMNQTRRDQRNGDRP